eukprot:Skav201349  [mRNA]  locus=scaffold2643:18494:19630:+ [translate_table: standard]
MAPRAKNPDLLFTSIKTSPLAQAQKLIENFNPVALKICFQPTLQNQTALFFAAARKVGQDLQALALCRLLLQRGISIRHTDELNQTALFYAARQGHADTVACLMRKGSDPNHRDKNGQTAIFYAVSKKRKDAVKALLDGGATVEVVDNWGRTCMSIAPPEILPILAEERKKRRRYEDLGLGLKRQRTALEELQSWANEWPIKECVAGQKIEYRDEDAVLQSGDGYAVVKNASEDCSARLRVSEKNFVVDHAQFFESELWFKELTPEEWCETVGVITDETGYAVDAIKTVVSGKSAEHFTLPLIHTGSKKIAGFVHATYAPEKEEMSIGHVKVDSEHQGKGLGGLLIAAAEDHSRSVGWQCRRRRSRGTASPVNEHTMP